MNSFPTLPDEIEHRTVPSLLRVASELAPDRVAVIGGSIRTGELTSMTYGEISKEVPRWASVLAQSGVGHGDRVGIVFENDGVIEALLAYHASHYLGAVACPLNTRYVVREMSDAIRLAAPQAVVFDARFGEVVEQAVGLESPEKTGLLAVGGRGSSPFALDDLSDADPHTESTVVSETDIADWIYTSGTTGSAKAATFTHAQVVACGLQAVTLWGLDETSRFYSFAPFYTSTGCHTNPLPCLTAMCTYIVDRDLDYGRFLSNIEDWHVTNIFIPTVLLALAFDRLSDDQIEALDMRTLRRLCYGGQPMPEAFHRRVHEVFCERNGAEASTLYGLTEGGPSGLMTPPDRHHEVVQNHGQYGVPSGRDGWGFNEWVESRIVLPDGNEAGPDEIGEILLRSPSVMLGYANAPEATDEVLGDGWLRTGDLGMRSNGGWVYFVDRVKHLIRRAGMNISSMEVEQVALGHPGVSEVVAVAEPNEILGEEVHLVVVPVPGWRLDRDGLIAHCRAGLAEYKVPSRVTFVDHLPRNAMARVVRSKLDLSLDDGSDPTK